MEGSATHASVQHVWATLLNVSLLSFQASTQADTGWNGCGTGLVVVSEPQPGVLIFNESGRWQQDGAKSLRFSNVFRWTLLPHALRLEHLRFGMEKPVYLFDIAPHLEDRWQEINPHICAEDLYRAALFLENDMLNITWSIHGPRKSETIQYLYQ